MTGTCHGDMAMAMGGHRAGMAMGASSGHHMMAGLPAWALAGAVAAAVIVTVWAIARGHRWFRHDRRWRIELTALPPVRWALRRRSFQLVFQLPLVLTLALIVWAGLYGTPVAERNAATVLTWTIWWTLLILDIVLLGRMWCMACPWEAIASWIRRLSLWRRTDEPLALDLPWPRWLRNVYPATLLFVGLTWLELGYGVTMSPAATAVLGLLMVVLAVVPALVFERRSFCKYGCLIGRIVGLYSTIAPVEVRARDADVCRGCKGKDCLTGNERGYPCPTGLCVGTLDVNTYCTVCTECFSSCPHDNVALNLRPWCSDLHTVRKPRRDEAMLALVMVSLTSFHGLTMTPTWNHALAWTMRHAGIGRLTAFSLLMAAMLALPIVAYLAVSRLTSALGAAERGAVAGGASLRRVATTYAYPLIAVALMYHLAHNAGHFLMEGAAVVPVLSDPLGTGADYLGTAGFIPRALASMTTVWCAMIAFVLLGHWWAMRALERAHRSLARARGVAVLPLRARVASAVFPLLITALNLWLLAQPMEMRTGM